MRAVLAAHDTAAESRRAAVPYRADHLHVAEAHMAGIGTTPSRSVSRRISATSRTRRAMIAAAYAGADRPWARPFWTSAVRGDCWPAVGRTNMSPRIGSLCLSGLADVAA